VPVRFSIRFPNVLVIQCENVRKSFLYFVLFISVDLHVCSQLTFDNDHNVFAIVVILILHMLPCLSAERDNADGLLQLLNIMGLPRNNMTDCCPLQIWLYKDIEIKKKNCC
jgi:hypothetical protein